MLEFSGKIALVTGGSRGIGFAVAKILADNGATVVITAKDSKRLEKSTSEIQNAVGIAADIRKSSEVKM